MSVLHPETLAVLFSYARKPRAPMFSNAVLAEQFEAAHSWGALRVYQRTDGKYAVVDTEALPGSQRTIAVCEHVSAADRIARLAATDGRLLASLRARTAALT